MGSFIYRFHRVVNLCQLSFMMVSASYMALMDAEAEGGHHGAPSHTFCVAYEPRFSKLPSSADTAHPLPLVDLSDKLGCSPSDFHDPHHNLSGTAVAVSRGDCMFTQKADLAQSVNASSILIIDYKNSSSLPVPIGNRSSDYNEINITVASVAWDDYQDVISLPGPVEVKIYAIKSSHFDPNMIIILFGSTLIIVVGALCSVHSERKRFSIGRTRNPGTDVENNDNNSSSSSAGNRSGSGSSSGGQMVEITPALVLFWVVFLIGILLLLYFFYDYAVFIFIVIFCIAGSHGLYTCLLPFWFRLFPFHHHVPQKLMLCIKEKLRVTSLILLILCFAFGIFWAIQRHASYAWIFQDILGTAFCISLLQALRLPSLKIISLVMVLLFCYDIFFVFITPLFTKNGESIMVEVATGGKGHHGEMVPLVFIVPLLQDHPGSVCSGRPFSILGFGDVILPGLLIVYNAIFDVHAKSKMAYLVVSATGYLVGMAGCLVVLVFMESGQPALFYLVPATLIPTYVLALKRGELRLMWAGKVVRADDGGSGVDGRYVRNGSVNGDGGEGDRDRGKGRRGEGIGNEEDYDDDEEVFDGQGEGEHSPLMNE